MSDKTTPVKALNNLHTVLAQVLLDELNRTETILVNDEEVEVSTRSAAMVAQARQFLKDNAITSVIDDDENLQELDKVLKAKGKHSTRLASVSPIAAAKEE